MKMFAFLALPTILGTGCHSTVNGQKDKMTASSRISDSTQPRVSWKVNRQVDSKGNLVRYDSTYIWTYSSDGKSGTLRVDSVMKDFQSRFSAQFKNVFDQNFGDPAWNDSLYYKNFFKHDYYLQRWMHDDAQMKSFLRQMDPTRNNFLNKQYPGPVPKTQS